MKKALVLATSCILLMGCAGTYGSAGQASEIQLAEGETLETLADDDPRMQAVVCRSEPVTGSLTRVNRICLTRAEWRALESNNAENVRTLQGRASGGAACQMDAQGGCSF